jgi:GNAT superfamily N-acetyltransferase
MEREVIRSDGRWSVVRAKPEDGALIAAIAAGVKAAEFGSEGKGFLVYCLTADEYRERIEEGHEVWLLLSDGEAVGYFLGVGSEMLARQKQGGGAAEAAYELALAHAARNGVERFLFTSQMAILPERQDGGLGGRFLAAIVGYARVPLYADIMEAPVRNPRIDFWMRHGFERIGECRERLPERFRFGGVSEVTWGIYVRRVSPAG